MEWITASLTDMMGTYWWIIIGVAIGTAAVILGLIAPIAERLEDVYGALVSETSQRRRVTSIGERSRQGGRSPMQGSIGGRKGGHELQGASS